MSAHIRDFSTVIFDLDGVVVDSEVLACRTLAETLGVYGFPIGLEEVFERFLGRSFATVAEHYETETEMVLPATFPSAYRERLAASFAQSLTATPGVGALLDALDRPYCLASSSDPERIRMTLAAAGLQSRFGDRIYSAAMVARAKPAPDLFLHVAGAMGAAPGETLVIEDTVTGVLAGKAAGMTVWGFVGGSHCAGRDTGRRLAGAGADRVVAALAELLP